MASLSDILTALQTQRAPQSAGEPFPPMVAGPDGPIASGSARPPEAPDRVPSWYRAVQPYPVNIMGAIDGALMAEGLGPAVQGAKSLSAMVRQAAGTPLGKAAMAGGAGLALTPTAASPQEPSVLDRLLKQHEAITAQRNKAADERAGQAKTGRGPLHKGASDELARLDEQLAELNKVIASEQEAERKRKYMESPEGRMELARRQKQAEIDENDRLKGLPVREHLPGWAQNMILPGATLAGVLMTKKLTGASNAEYQRALSSFDSAMKAGDVPAMTIAQKALANLENPSLGQKAKTAASALLPAEIRLAETGIDLSKDRDTKAHKDAMDRISNPWSLGYDVGSSALASALSYGLGSKLAKPYVDRGRGAAIASETPFESATPLASGYANALRQGEDVRKLLPAPAAAAPGSSGAAEQPRGLLSRILDTLSGRGSSAPSPALSGPSSGQSQPLALPGPAPQPAASPNLSTSDILRNMPGVKPANNPTLPDHLMADSSLNGSRIRDKRTGQIASDPNKKKD